MPADPEYEQVLKEVRDNLTQEVQKHPKLLEQSQLDRPNRYSS